jgi:Fe-S-cluster-containing dehydrogenase component/DMSO reductase anchor subunit
MPSAPESHERGTLIDALLSEQRDLTAVERFARWHESSDSPPAPSYRHLLPLSAPAPGEQYAFEVDLDRCSGCKSCVAACHSLNGLDDGETWRGVGLLVTAKSEIRNPRSDHATAGPKSEIRSSDFGSRISDFGFQQHVTTACHHCVDPGCLNGCPVLAYDKDPLTGIVRHLDDQCIGCQYCVFMCPYEVPQYSERRGIVRKCDMCSQRLAHGEAPACVQACPSEAIRITVVERQERESRPALRSPSPLGGDRAGVRGEGVAFREHTHIAAKPHPSPSIPLPSEGRGKSESREHSMFDVRCSMFDVQSGFPDPAITLPTTRYVSAKGLPAKLRPADADDIHVQPSHLPLVWMLVLTQLAAGGFAVLPLSFRAAQPGLAMVSGVATFLGLAGSILHLGRPLKAWRAFLGLRRSWLSREIVVFGVFAILAMATTFAIRTDAESVWKGALSWTTAAFGLVGVFCSGMVYHVTQRECWRGARSIGRFFGTTAVLGFAVGWVAASAAHLNAGLFAGLLVCATLPKISRELAELRLCPDDADRDELPGSAVARGSYLRRFKFGQLLRSHFMCAWIGGVVLPLIHLLLSPSGLTLPILGAALCLAGELMERTLFFRAVVVPRMPGNPAA